LHFLTRRLGRPCTALAHPNAGSQFSQASMHGDRDTDVRAFREIVQKAALRRAVEQDRIPAAREPRIVERSVGEKAASVMSSV